MCPEINKVELILGLKYMISLGGRGCFPKSPFQKIFTQNFYYFFLAPYHVLLVFSALYDYLFRNKVLIMENIANQQAQQPFKYKRTSKTPSPETRQKLSNALKGKPKSSETKERISQSLHAYWSDPNNFPDDKTGGSWGDVMEE